MFSSIFLASRSTKQILCGVYENTFVHVLRALVDGAPEGCV